MHEQGKYLIHAEITADGVVERSDVVGAIFGQTEGLLGDQLELRTLQDASKVGRIDVTIDSENGVSVGEVQITTRLDRIETATLAAALETITRVGPCHATVEVTSVEDLRAAKRRQVVERAQELLEESFSGHLSSDELIEEVRSTVEVDDLGEYEGLPAGPQIKDSDAVIIVEGRADVKQLLEAGIENAVAVEGTDVPDSIGPLSEARTTTAFLDGDRGGELIYRELRQVADLDYVAFAPAGSSVEGLTEEAIVAALREKVPADVVDAPDPTTGKGTTDKDTTGKGTTDNAGSTGPDTDGPRTILDHAEAIVGTDQVRLLGADGNKRASAPAAAAFDQVEEAADSPHAVVLDGTVTQRLLDIAAQRGVRHVIGTERGELTKQPTDVRLRTVDELTAVESN